jgi:hypothetical protein
MYEIDFPSYAHPFNDATTPRDVVVAYGADDVAEKLAQLLPNLHTGDSITITRV